MLLNIVKRYQKLLNIDGRKEWQALPEIPTKDLYISMPVSIR